MDAILPVPDHLYRTKSSIGGTLVMTGGSMVANTTEPPMQPLSVPQGQIQTGTIGIIIALTGLATILVQAYRAWLDSKSQARLVAEQNAKIQEQANSLKTFEDKVAAIEAKREDERQKRHDLANTMNRKLLEIESKYQDSQIEVAILSTKLGLADKNHAAAINTNSKNIETIASRIDMPLPVETPHVEPLASPLVPKLTPIEE